MWPSRQQLDPVAPQQGGHSASQPVEAMLAAQRTEVQDASAPVEAAVLVANAEAVIQWPWQVLAQTQSLAASRVIETQ